MVPKIHAKGKSFRGAALYLLHDKGRASTAERVEWVETRNMATGNPDAAWRVMAYTAMDQDRLKAQAGIKNTGRKSKASVMHLTLSWHPDEAGNVTPEEMRRAAVGALRALNAQDRQAMFVCHNDEPQPHLHILINRVSPEDGRMLSSSKEKLNLSAWAQHYEEERGEILCEQRVINNAARNRDEYTRGQKDKARNVYEMEADNDNRPDADKIRKAELRKSAKLAERTRKTRERHAREAATLEAGHKKRLLEIAAKTKKDIHQGREAVRSDYRKPWAEQHHEHQAQMRLFEKRETKLIGRVQNTFRAIDIRSLIGRRTDGNAGTAVRGVFDAIGSAGARREALKRQQEREDRALQAEQREKERQAAEAARGKERERLEENRRRFVADRMQYLLARKMDQAALRAAWRTRNDERREAWQDQRAPAPSVRAKQSPDQAQGQEATDTADKAQKIAAYEDRMRARLRAQRDHRGRDKDGRDR